MGKKLRKLLFGLSFLIALMLTLTVPVSAKEEEESVKEIDIMLTPEKVIFDLDNLKPGDWAERTVTITNSGKKDFNYIVSGKRKSGSELFYRALQLVIKGPSGELFNGYLSEFKKLSPSEIVSGESETLTFIVKVPENLGNAYQGLKTEVEFKFYAEGTMGGVLPIDGPKLPTTATDYFNLLAAGGVMVGGGFLLFRLKKKMKN